LASQRWQQLENPLAQALLSGKIQAGGGVVADVEGGRLVFLESAWKPTHH
jgi:ATP-dependent Clp protease ATP-binding subunit ClpA